jgi:hypothetical protein
MSDGFHVEVSELRAFGGQLDGLSSRASKLAETLAGITADTGRGDSDQMGRNGPHDASESVKEIGAEIHDDSGLVKGRADTYEGVDLDAASMFNQAYA